MTIKCIAFDCFKTVFDMSTIPHTEIMAYVDHVNRQDFRLFAFPPSWWTLRAHPDAAEGIRMLQASGYECVTLSNGGVSLLAWISELSGITWNHITDLAAHRAYKPKNLDAYRAVEKDTGYLAAETLMVTANPTFGDLESSAAIGMPSKVIRNPGELADINALHQWLTEGWE